MILFKNILSRWYLYTDILCMIIIFHKTYLNYPYEYYNHSLNTISRSPDMLDFQNNQVCLGLEICFYNGFTLRYHSPILLKSTI